MYRILAPLLALTLCGLAYAEKKAPPAAIAVLPVESKGIVDGSSLKPIQERLRNLLLARPNIEVTPLNRSDAYLSENRISLPSLCKEDCRVKLGSELQASYILIPALTKDASGLSVALDLFEVKTQKVVGSSRTNTQGELSGALSQAINELMDGSPKLSSSTPDRFSKTTWTLIELGGSALVIGGLVLFTNYDQVGGTTSRPIEEPSAKGWTDNVELK